MRRLGQPITVTTDAAQQPRLVELPGGRRRVEAILDRWTERGRWWEGERPRRFYRVEAGGQFDLSCDDAGQWRVEVMWD